MKGRNLGLKSTMWNKRKKQTFNWNRMNKQKFKKMRRGLGTSGTALIVSISKSQGYQKEKNNSKKLKSNLNK